MFDGIVVHEMQLGQGVDVNAPSQFATQKTGRPLQAALDFLKMIGIQRREKDLGVRIIRRQFDRRQADHADPRVLELRPDQIGKVAAHLLRDPVTTLKAFFLHYSERATSWIS